MKPPARVLAAVTGLATVAASVSVASLSVSGLATPAQAATPAEDLLISEYVEGSGTNKALEIYNGTEAPVDLTGYQLAVSFNGATTAGLTLDLVGEVAVGDVHVVAASGAVAAVTAEADQTTGAGLWNGDDAIALTHDGAVVDSLGQRGVDPGSRWGSGLVSTQDATLRRMASICSGDTVDDDPFDPAPEWVGFATDTFDRLGSHTSDCTDEGGDPGDGDPGDGDPGDPDEPLVCGEPSVPVGEVQGSGTTSPLVGEDVQVEGVVVGDFQSGGFDGYYLQDGGDGDAATSDGIFVHGPGSAAVEVGDTVRVGGTVAESFGMTQVGVDQTEVCDTGQPVPAPVALTLPMSEADLERHEGMHVTFSQDLTVLEYFNYGRFGEIALGTERQYQPTSLFEPGSEQAQALAAKNLSERITLDDGSSRQNPDPARHPDGQEFTLDNRFRGGDVVSGLTGVLDWRFDLWRVQPTQGAEVTAANPRPDVPEIGGSTTVASFNVLNYFTTLGSRGADTARELQRQEDKIVAALAEMDADVVGLIEIENNATAVATLTEALNAEIGEDRYAYVDTGVIGTDEITTAFIYQPAEVTPEGDFATLTGAVDPRFRDDFNRPTLAQTFTDTETGGAVTVAVNHLKSKGSGCEAVGDPEDPDGQGNCNQVRTAAATAMAEWLDADPTGTGVDGTLVIGDLNSYAMEDPITALTDAGYTDLLAQLHDGLEYSYVFDGQLGYLDHALADRDLREAVVSAETWKINADEPSLIDYDTTFKAPAQQALYAPDPYRSSDHDPVVVGLDLTPVDTAAPTLQLSAEPEVISPADRRGRLLEIDVEAGDDSGSVETELVGAEAQGRGAHIKTYDDTRFRVTAAPGASYTFRYTATDPAGNTTTESITVAVAS